MTAYPAGRTRRPFFFCRRAPAVAVLLTLALPAQGHAAYEEKPVSGVVRGSLPDAMPAPGRAGFPFSRLRGARGVPRRRRSLPLRRAPHRSGKMEADPDRTLPQRPPRFLEGGRVLGIRPRQGLPHSRRRGARRSRNEERRRHGALRKLPAPGSRPEAAQAWSRRRHAASHCHSLRGSSRHGSCRLPEAERPLRGHGPETGMGRPHGRGRAVPDASGAWGRHAGSGTRFPGCGGNGAAC